jgi:hypothetical protein
MASVRQVVAEIIDLPPLDPEAPGPFRYGEADKLLTLLDRAGYGDLDVTDWRGVLPIGGGLPAAEVTEFAHSHLFLRSASCLPKRGTRHSMTRINH